MLPSNKTTIETLTLKEDAKPWVDQFIARNNELEEIFDVIQPLLYKISIHLYGDDHSPRNLAVLVKEGCEYLDKIGVQNEEE